MLVPLRVFSCHSLLRSSITYSQAIEYCKKENLKYIGIANENSMFGIFKWTQNLIKNCIKPITGSALKVENGFVWAYCLNEEGFKELSHLLAESYLKYNQTLPLSSLKLKNCVLLCDWSLKEEEIAYLKRNNNVMIAISRQKRDRKYENNLFEVSNILNLPIIAAPKFFYGPKTMQLETDCLWCIRNNTYIQEDDREIIFEDEYFKTQKEYAEDFKDIPWAITNSELLAQKCNFQIQSHPPRMPKIEIDNPQKVFENKIWKGFEKRLKNNIFINIENTKEQKKKKEEYKKRLEYEIEVIKNMNFPEYFLIVSEIINWAKSNNIIVGPGRGSGAGSLVAYCLDITNIDPMKFNLMFERFLNPDRVSLPDFDVDFCQKNRHKVIDFIKIKFGKKCVAHIVTFGSLQYRAALRDIARVLQFPYQLVDDLCKKLPAPFQGVAPTLKELREKKISTEFFNSENEQLFKIAENIEGLPRHSSIHAAGIIISNEELSNICPIFKEPEVDMPITQFDMKDSEAIGLVKFDILGLTILSTISDTLELLKKREIFLNLDNLDLNDQNIFKMITQGYTNSLFQIDSVGMRQILKEMNADCFEDIVATTSLYRPGPMAEISRFIGSKNGSIQIIYEYPELEPILKETYGVTVYQEQVLSIAKILAGYSLKEADLLRRAMGKKNHEEMEMNKKKFVEGVLKICKGTKEKAERFFDNLASFASYGFNRAHATCYSMITYQTAYLKCYYTIEFLCSSMINEINLEKISDMIQEAINFNIEVHQPNINVSNNNFDIINNSIYFGITKIKGVGESAHNILEERQKNGYFTSLQNFMDRININKKALENLILVGAFDEFNKNRAELIQEAQNKNTKNLSLFDDFFKESVIPLTPTEQAIEELDKLGFVFSSSLLNLKLDSLGIFEYMEKIKVKGLIYALGIKPLVKNTKEGRKIFGYEFFDKKGHQQLFSGELFEIKNQLVILDIEKLSNRYFLKKVYSLNDYLANIKKIFLNKDCTQNLKEGDTSIYLQDNTNGNKFIGDFLITFEFLDKFKEQIVVIQ